MSQPSSTDKVHRVDKTIEEIIKILEKYRRLVEAAAPAPAAQVVRRAAPPSHLPSKIGLNVCLMDKIWVVYYLVISKQAHAHHVHISTS